MIIIISTFVLFSCNAQTKKKLDKKQTETSKEKIEPKIDYKVNKEYDDFGNLIKYDSTYTYYYSNLDKNTLLNDSIFTRFNNYFNLKKQLIDDSFFNDFLKQKDYFNEDFFTEDFFRGNFKKNHEMMNKLLLRMDSIKNDFFLKEFPLKEENKKH